VRNESLLAVVPELGQILKYSSKYQAEQRTFVQSYNNVADSAWPKITTVNEFYALTEAIQQEVKETFNIIPPIR
jgi:hypothetical protein